MKQIFIETGRSIENLIIKINFEVMVYNFYAVMVMGSVQAPLTPHAYSYVNFQNNIISFKHTHIGPKILQILAPPGKFVLTHLTLLRKA